MTNKIYAAATVVLTALASCSPFWSESLISVQATVHEITPPPTTAPATLTQTKP